jgi:hypothetical protein
MGISQEFIDVMNALGYVQRDSKSWMFRRDNQPNFPHFYIDFSQCNNDITRISNVIFFQGILQGEEQKIKEIKSILKIY